MATNLNFENVAPPRAAWRSDQQFFVTMNIVCSVLVVFGFAQFALRGFVDPMRAPWWVHVHGLAMLAWLGLNVFQAQLAHGGSIAQHRRLMLVALIFILEPALGRILPMPLLQPYAQWWELAFQLLFLAIAMGHDQRHRGAIHPAFWLGAVVLIGFHGLVFGLSHLPPWVAMAESLRT